MNNIYTIGIRSLHMVLESNPHPNVGVCLPHKRCLSIWSQNHVEHNEDVVFTYGDCDIPCRIREKVSDAIYIYELILRL